MLRSGLESCLASSSDVVSLDVDVWVVSTVSTCEYMEGPFCDSRHSPSAVIGTITDVLTSIDWSVAVEKVSDCS